MFTSFEEFLALCYFLLSSSPHCPVELVDIVSTMAMISKQDFLWKITYSQCLD